VNQEYLSESPVKRIEDEGLVDVLNSDRRILIVDDEPYNIMGLKIILMQSSVPNIVSIIEEAYNGKEAISKVKQAYEKGYSYGLIFMDCSMPVLDGYDASDLIRAFVRD
jgi:CheY-like chemotaxis protein